MILRLLLNIFGILIQIILNIVTEILPSNGLGGNLATIITTILSFTQQALNFAYLIFGDTLFLVMPIVTMLLFEKYVALPVIILVRSFFINSNE